LMRAWLLALACLPLAASATAAAEDWHARCAEAAPTAVVRPCEEALLDDADDTLAMKRLGDFYLGNHGEWQAVELYARRIRLEPENFEAWFDHAAALATMWYFAEASLSMHGALALQPDNLLAHRLAAIVFERSGETEAAFATHRMLAEAGIETGMYDLAKDYHYGRGIAADGVAARLWYERAAVAGHVGAMAALAEHLPYGALGPADPGAAEHWRREADAARRSFAGDAD